MVDNNTRVVLQKRFADEPILICLGVCSHDLKRVGEQQFKKMVRRIKNIMGVLLIKRSWIIMAKKRHIEQANEDIP